MTIHTPGPWEVGTGYVTARKDGHCGVICVMACDRSVMKYAAKDGSDEDGMNARLIAAAPELLKELITYHDREWSRIGHEGIPVHIAGELPGQCSACNAIKKAKGE